MADIENKDIGGTEADAGNNPAAPADTAEQTAAKSGVKEKAAKSDKKSKKSDKPSVFNRIGAWFKSCRAEMKKIVWSSPKSVLNNSIMVIVTIIVIGLAIGLLDYIFSAGIVGLNRII